jgi:transketolase
MFNKKQIIKDVVKTCFISKEGHIPSSLSILDLLLVFYGKILNKEKNYFILSKGHASLGLFSVLNYFDLLEESLDNYCDFNSKLGGHPTNMVLNVEASTGSLGHGLPISVGIALGEKIKKTNKRVFVIIGDGESNEGTIWESALIASNHNLDNLCCIMDYNHSNDRALKLDDVISKFKSFNWDCYVIDGHNQEEIFEILQKKSNNQPMFILANTIKGKGCYIMENNPEWHHKVPTELEYNKILEML